MKANALPVLFIILAAAISCQKPCTKTTIRKGYYGDTTFIERTYANCTDTLTYYEKQMRSDSTVVSEGEVVNGKKEGEWVNSRWRKEVTSYSQGVEINVKEYDNDGILSLERTLGTDSLYRQRQFDGQGRLTVEEFVNMEGYLTGHGITYDSLGRKTSEGEHIAEPCLTDTVYIESPEPPYDLQMTIIEDLGGKHGLWTYYDADGNVTDTVMFDHGVPLREADRFKTGFHQNGSEPKMGVGSEDAASEVEVLLGGKSGGIITKEELLRFFLTSSDKEWSVSSFDLVLPVKGENVTFPCEGSVFSERAKLAIASLKVGDVIHIELIRVKKGSKTRKCDSRQFTIAEAEKKSPNR
ncbi:MAG: hypothetical protein GC178_08855 [Flavobacteriales bacterium]|nr:hypothetical protein [Flavobacteriales bacterium]